MDKPTLLIVEDDGILAANLESHATALGYEVLGPTASGEEALALLQDRSADLVIMDIELAGQLNGIETAEIITRTHGIPIIFLSGFSQEALLEEAKNIVPYGYLIKPVPERELAAAVAMGLHRAALDRSLAASRQALTESEARYRHLFENSPLGIFRTTMDGRALLVNREMARMVGCASPEEAIRNFSDLARQLYVDPRRRTELIAQLKARGEVRHFEYQGRKQNGELIWIDMNARLQTVPGPDGMPLAVIDGFAQDITAEKMARQALNESEERFRTIFEYNTAMMLLLDAASGAIIDANPSAAAFYGWSIEELRQMSIREINTLPQEILWAQMQLVIASESTRFEFLHRLADGSIRDVEVFSSPIDIGGRQLLFSIIHDVTERKRTEEEKKRLQVQLAQAQKLEAIGTLAGGIAHDFNNILGGIIGFTDMALLQCDPGSELHDHLRHIRLGGRRAADLVQQILTFSRQSSEEKAPVLIVPLVTESLKLLRATLPATIEIRQELLAGEAMVKAAPVQIQQVVMNLCANAFHSMREQGGQLTVRIEETDAEALGKADEGGARRWVSLLVRDTGLGIEDDILHHIFTPFFTTKEPGEGAGLGLSVVHGIVTDLGGEITVQSRRGEGTTFTILLPVTEAATSGVLKSSEGVLPSGTEHILVVDDEKEIRDICRMMLGHLGYIVTTTGRPEEVLGLLADRLGRIDLVITDQTMPRLTGVELTRAIRQGFPHIPVILCTGYSDRLNADIAREAGACDLLMKPVDLRGLSAAVRAALDRN